MNTNRMLQIVRCAIEASIKNNSCLITNQLTALLLLQKDRISELEREVAGLRLTKRYKTDQLIKVLTKRINRIDKHSA